MKLPLIRYLIKYWYLLIFIFGGVYFRFYGLGENYFGGDELSTIDYLITTDKKLPSISAFLIFLLSQDRGPGQYILNFINILLFGYVSEFQLRFPYFLFSLGSVLSIFVLVKYIFKNITLAVFSAYLISINGLFIVFGRVAQYQSLLTFLIPLSIYYYFKGFEQNKIKLIITSAVLFSVCLISHFDALSAVILYICYFIFRKLKNKNIYIKGEGTKNFIIFSLTALVLSGLVYLPYVFYDQRTTLNYLGGRIFGRYFLYPNNTYEKLGRILELYMPLESWVIISILCILGLFSLAKYISNKKVKIGKISTFFSYKYLYKTLLILLVIFFLPTSLHIIGRLGSLAIIIIVTTLCILLGTADKINPKISSLSIWFLVSFYVYFYLFNDPRTHIYISFLPGLCFAGVGLNYLFDLNSSKIYRIILVFLFASFSLFNTYFYYLVFIDKDPEYLWNSKNFLYKELPVVNRSNNSGLKLFGFTTNNHFSEIKNLFDQGCLIGSYASNERWETTQFYIERRQVVLDIRNLYSGPDNIIYFISPNIWNSLTLKRANSFKEYKLLKIYYNNNLPSVYIYGKRSTYNKYNKPCLNIG